MAENLLLIVDKKSCVKWVPIWQWHTNIWKSSRNRSIHYAIHFRGHVPKWPNGSDVTAEQTVGQRVMGHGSNGSINVNGSRGSRVRTIKHLTH